MKNAFIDLVRLQTRNGRIPATIPAHYVRFAYEQHCATRGRRAKTVDGRNIVTLSRTLHMTGPQP